MFAIASSLSVHPFAWSLLFTRQPEPDLEFTEAWLDPPSTIGSPSPQKPPNQSHHRLLLWVLFFLLISGGAYVATEPEMVTRYLEPRLDKTPAPQPPVARNPTPPMAAPSKQPEQDWSFLAPGQTTTPSSPAAAPIPATSDPIKAPSTATASAPAKTPPPATPSEQPAQDWSFLAQDDIEAPSSPTRAPQAAASVPVKKVEQDAAFLARIQSIRDARNATPGARGAPVPLFSEGQRVSLRPDLNAPGWAVLLRQDAEGTKPGLTIPPGTVLTILDGDLQGRNWVYFVRSDTGHEGWLTEGQLRLKR